MTTTELTAERKHYFGIFINGELGVFSNGATVDAEFGSVTKNGLPDGWDVVIATRNGEPYMYRRIDGDMCRDGHPVQGTARWFSQNPRVLECGVIR